jgi:hypothetical protein
LIATLGLFACEEARHPSPPPPPTGDAPPPPAPRTEPHLADLRQLTFGGENAEAYWSMGGEELIFQARTGDMQCDRIYRMKVADPKQVVPVSNGKGATTCSYFLPGDTDVVFASTESGGDACPPKPSMEFGYTWALYDSYEIYRAKADGTGQVRLTDSPGYDAEATVCKKDGTILFTSVRDGDIDLYRMDADGKNVKRLTTEPGYDGGAFFSDDCSKIVWRASRPKGKALDDFKSLLAKGLVRPTKLELYVADADGTDPVQVTYLDAASFGPYLFPDGKRILFSSNYGDPKGREFDLWMIGVDGTGLERVTSSPGFDGFPMFSPDGKQLAFASNRNNAPGSRDTNVFVARWTDEPGKVEDTAAERIVTDARWLADPAREGRGVGTRGLEEAGAFVETRLRALGLQPVFGGGSYRQPFEVPMSVQGKVTLAVDGKPIEGARILAFSGDAKDLTGDLVLAGHGIQTDGWDDYAKLDVKGKIVLVRRFVPDDKAFSTSEATRRHGDLRRKAWLAREKGAKAMIVVDLPAKPRGAPAGWKPPDEAKLPSLAPDASGEAGLPAVIAPRAALEPIVAALEKKKTLPVTLTVAVTVEKKPAFNVAAKLAATGPSKGTIVVGAHYDHLGMGGHGSLAPDQVAVHHGADDNASGTATVLEIARALVADESPRTHDVVFGLFSGEERGVLGSNYFVKNAPPGLQPKDLVAMINLDMVGRVRGNKLDVTGHDTATELGALLQGSCDRARIDCALLGGGGYGPSDQASFYAAGVPVLFLFSGTHADYHKPSDTSDKLNGAGMGAVSVLTTDLVAKLAKLEQRLTFQKVASPAPTGDPRSFGASLGTIPDYAASASTKGVVLSGVRPGGAADLAGAKRGDVLVKVGRFDVGSVEDLMFALGELRPKAKIKLVVLRDGKRVELDATVQEAKQKH